MPRPGGNAKRCPRSHRCKRAALEQAAPFRRAFSLVELLVVISIILVLMGLFAAAVVAARGSQKKQATQALIAKLDAIIQRQYATYTDAVVDDAWFIRENDKSAAVDEGRAPEWRGRTYSDASKLWDQNPVAARAWFIRRHLITADLPDRWSDVEYLANHTDLTGFVPSGRIEFPKEQLTAAQRAYVNTWNAFSAAQKNLVGQQYAGAECLFMIVMQGGLADGDECQGLAGSPIGDKDGDGALEFHDAWGNPVGFILWPAAFEQVKGGDRLRYFEGDRALFQPVNAAGFFIATEDVPSGGEFGVLNPGEDVNGNGRLDYVSPGLGMRPLIYSAGSDGEDGLDRGLYQGSEVSNLGAHHRPPGACCGPKLPPELPWAGCTSPNLHILGGDCGNWWRPPNVAPCPPPSPCPTSAGPFPADGEGIAKMSDNIANLDVGAPP